MDDQQLHDPRFAADDDGAVTVDWVVLTAAIVGLGALVVIPVAGGTSNLATAVSTTVSGADVNLVIPPLGQ